jgi:hydroxyacylglutathione hydrolase
MRPAAERLFASAQEFLSLPDYLQVWPGHGAGSACGKALGAVPDTTVGYERRFSPALHFVQKSEDEFVDFILEGQPEPPLYFERMKRWNRDGPPVLGALPQPSRMTAAEVGAVAGDNTTVVVDARIDRQQFMDGHLAGSLYAPLDNTFPTITGSYIEAELDIVLIVPEEGVEAAVLDLIRIGLDRVVGWAEPAVLKELPTVTTRVAQITDLDQLRQDGNGLVLDVRRKTEFDEGHFPGAVNVAHTRLKARIGEVPEGRDLFVHCRSGARAAAAASFLESQGRKVVYVDGLFEDWLASSAASEAAVQS